MQNKENKIKIGYIDTLVFRVRFSSKAKKLKTILDAIGDYAKWIRYALFLLDGSLYIASRTWSLLVVVERNCIYIETLPIDTPPPALLVFVLFLVCGLFAILFFAIRNKRQPNAVSGMHRRDTNGELFFNVLGEEIQFITTR